MTRQLLCLCLCLCLCLPLPLSLGAASVVSASSVADNRQPGGDTTPKRTPVDPRLAFSKLSSNLSRMDALDAKIGHAFFDRPWASAPSSTQASDGLGPLYNARACSACHVRNGRGLPTAGEHHSSGLVLHVSVEDGSASSSNSRPDSGLFTPDPVYGKQLQTFATSGLDAEAQVSVSYRESVVTLADGQTVTMHTPEYRISELNYGPLAADHRFSPRVGPGLIGLGLLEHIDEADILAWEDPDDRDNNGIRGIAQRVISQPDGQTRIGRFGHKAARATLDEQNQSAFHTDIGLSVPLARSGSGDCTESQPACLNAPNGNSPQYDKLEAHKTVTDAVLLFTRNVAPPRRVSPVSERALQNENMGEKLFREIGCQQCHRPSFTTGPKAADGSVQKNLANQRIHPYTDLLLHDMGEGLADHRREGDASGRHWRTAPLWGIGRSAGLSGVASYLHDGRARSLIEAILWHGGEAQPHRDAVIALPAKQRAQLLAFLKSL